jgi:hypothetical protein
MEPNRAAIQYFKPHLSLSVEPGHCLIDFVLVGRLSGRNKILEDGPAK